MAKIQRNRSDAEMMAGWKEVVPQGESAWAEDEPKGTPNRTVAQSKASLNESFITPELAEKIGKALLEMKLALYKEGIIDYDIKIGRETRQVILTAVPRPAVDLKQEGKK